MTDLDRLLELRENLTLNMEGIPIPDGDTKEEYQLLYDKLKNNAEIIEKIRKLGFHTMPIPQDSTSFAQFSKKQNKLKSILENKK